MNEITITQSNQVMHAARILRKGEVAVITLKLPAEASKKVATILAPQMSEGIGFSLYLTGSKDSIILHLSSELDSGVQIERRWGVGISYIGKKELTKLVALIKSVHH